MFGIGTGELLLLLVIALIVLGPERMPKLARDLGRALAEFRKTSDELRNEFLNADKYLDTTATAAPPPALPAPEAAGAPATETPPIPVEPDETAFDREAREARARLRDPERLEQAKAEGWKTPTDEAGTSDRWG
ncbi:MAG TPA: twin-arginine translocase TatA/TatE family subunit [Candidatus Limnocylindria bacterium]